MNSLTIFSFVSVLSASFLRADSALPAITLDSAVVERLGLVTEPLREQQVVDLIEITAQSTLDPERTHVVASLFTGRIDLDSAPLGSTVEKGQILARLESREVAEMISRYLETTTRLEAAQLSYQRESEMRARKLTTEDEYLKVKMAYQEAAAARASAMQAALLVRSSRELALLNTEAPATHQAHLPLTAPIAGVVIEKSKLPGQSVETNEELFKIADLSQLQVELQIPIRGADRIRVGDLLPFETLVGPKLSGELTLTMISPIIQKESLTFTAIGTLPNPDGLWHVGLPLRVKLGDARAPEVLAVPLSAVVKIEDETHVFVAQPNGRFQPVAVTLGHQSQEAAEVLDGLAPGVEVVTAGASLLRAAWDELSNE